MDNLKIIVNPSADTKVKKKNGPHSIK